MPPIFLFMISRIDLYNLQKLQMSRQVFSESFKCTNIL